MCVLIVFEIIIYIHPSYIILIYELTEHSQISRDEAKLQINEDCSILRNPIIGNNFQTLTGKSYCTLCSQLISWITHIPFGLGICGSIYLSNPIIGKIYVIIYYRKYYFFFLLILIKVFGVMCKSSILFLRIGSCV